MNKFLTILGVTVGVIGIAVLSLFLVSIFPDYKMEELEETIEQKFNSLHAVEGRADSLEQMLRGHREKERILNSMIDKEEFKLDTLIMRLGGLSLAVDSLNKVLDERENGHN
jgi:uncharacterized protein YoxC